MNFSDEEEKREYLFRYSIRFTIATAVVIGGFVLLLYCFGDSPFASSLLGWLFGIAFIVGAFFMLRYFYLWFK